MSGDGGKQLPRAKSKKRRHLCIMDTESSDDGDAPTVKPRRKPRVNKTTCDSNKKDRGKSGDSEVAGSSRNEEIKPAERTKSASKSKNTKIEATNSRDSKSEHWSDSSKKLLNKNAAAGSTVVKSGEEKGENSDDQSAEHCPICWLPFKEQQVAVPTTCDHSFCLQCILKWSAHSNTCPVDRQTFNMIQVHENYGGETTRQMPIATKTLHEVVTADEANDGDSPFLIFHSNSTSSEWEDLENSDPEIGYYSSVDSYLMFEATDGPDDSPMSEDNEQDPFSNDNRIDSSTTEDTNFSPIEPSPSDYENLAMGDYSEQRASSSLSIQHESSPSLCDYSNDITSDGLSTTPPHRLITLRQYNSSDSPDSSISSIDSSSSSSVAAAAASSSSSSSTSY